MEKVITVILLLLMNAPSFSQTNEKEAEQETKSLFEVQVNSEKYIIEEGEELDIGGSLINPKISIKQLDIKKFNAGNVTFEYPSNFSFEFEESEGYKNWTLDGNDYVIMIFDIDGESQAEDFIENIISQFGRENCKTKELETNIGEKKLSGIQLYIELVGQKLTIDFYQYSASENNSKYISFQDMLNDDGTSSNEGIKAFKMIAESIEYK